MRVSNLVRMVVLMGDSEPSQRLVFCLKFVRFTFLKGMKAKSNPLQGVSFSTCNKWALMCITGLLKIQHISVVASAFPLQQKQKAFSLQTQVMLQFAPILF